MRSVMPTNTSDDSYLRQGRRKKPTSRHQTTTKVSFGNVAIREYARCLGNNPTLSHDGPSLSIDWKYKCKRTVSLDEYEQMKEKRNHTQVMLHQKPLSFSARNFESLSGPIRWRIIREHTKCTNEEIQSNIEESYQADRQRQLCYENQGFEAFHIMLESAQRKLCRFHNKPRKGFSAAQPHRLKNN